MVYCLILFSCPSRNFSTAYFQDISQNLCSVFKGSFLIILLYIFYLYTSDKILSKSQVYGMINKNSDTFFFYFFKFNPFHSVT